MQITAVIPYTKKPDYHSIQFWSGNMDHTISTIFDTERLSNEPRKYSSGRSEFLDES